MSCKVQQSVCSDCVTYAKSRIKFNTLNTFNNVTTIIIDKAVESKFESWRSHKHQKTPKEIMFISFYFSIATMVVMYIIWRFVYLEIRTDEIISMINDDELREYLSKNPIQFKWAIFLFIAFMGIAWPVTIIRIIGNFFDDINNRRGR